MEWKRTDRCELAPALLVVALNRVSEEVLQLPELGVERVVNVKAGSKETSIC